ncbi:MAG: TatD family hydrolase [Bacteroidetes bacterium]|nr:TatD family hydrolase [Bacteroidota bacterium]
MLIDTHAHLYLEHFQEDISDTIARCYEKNVQKVVLPNIDVESISALRETCKLDTQLFHPALGMHPCSVNENWESELSKIKEVIDHGLDSFPTRNICGIGEIGLDYYWDKTHTEAQKEALKTQIGWAKELNLPIILHCRDAFDDLYEIVTAEYTEGLKGIFHCFGGTLDEAQKVMELNGFYMGLGGVLTFKKANELRDVVKDIPMEYLVLETDAPYLTPTPFRGKRNESSYVHYVAETLATVKDITLDEVARMTTENAQQIFGI